MDAIRHYLAMGGYAAYVWPAYGIAAAVLIGLTWQSLREVARRERELAEIEAMRPRRARRARGAGSDA
jgi:heme exporter protein D